MNSSLSSIGSALSSAVNTPVTSDPIQQIQAKAQVSILKKAMQAQADTTTTLINSVTSGSVGRTMDVRA